MPSGAISEKSFFDASKIQAKKNAAHSARRF
jgi:hypothetical protein